MNCWKCNAKICKDDQFCPNCGEEITALMLAIPENLKDYIKRFAPQKIKQSLRNAAILSYVCAGCTAIATAVIGNYFGLIDVIVFLALTLGMHLGKNKICAYLMLLLSVIEIIYAVVVTGQYGGIFWLFASAFAVNTFKKAEKLYGEYLSLLNNR